MGKSTIRRVSVAIYMTLEQRDALRRAYGANIACGVDVKEQRFLFDALMKGAGLVVNDAKITT